MLDARNIQTGAVESFDPFTNHEEVVAVEGLEDLFAWASDLVADGSDPRLRRTKEARLRRNVLDVMQRNRDLEAKEKYAGEINYLQKRVVALLQVVSDKVEENATLKNLIMTQYLALGRVADLEAEVKELEKLTWYRDEAEAERKHQLDALAKMKKERDYLEELVTANEQENARLAELLSNVRVELTEVKARKWWHKFFPPSRK